MRKLKNYIKWLLFVSAYIPLFLIIILKNFKDFIQTFNYLEKVFHNIFNIINTNGLKSISIIINTVWSYGFLVFLGKLITFICFLFLILSIPVSFFCLWKIKREVENSDYNEFKIITLEDKTSDSLNYVVSYIIAFLSISLNNFIDLVAIFILLFTIATIYINSNLIYINPVLNWFGYIVLKVTYYDDFEKQNKDIILITHNREKIKEGNFRKLANIDKNIYLL